MNDDRPPPSLASVIDAAMAKQQTKGYRELSRRSDELKVPISHTTLAAMHKGTYASEVSKDMRQRLATLAGLPIADLNGVTGFAGQQPFVLPDSADTLNAEQRDAVLAVVRAFANANKEGAGRGTAAATKPPRSNVRQLRGTDTPAFDETRDAAKRRRPRPKNTDVTSE